MATFVLVHGAWHGSWCWQRVRRALERQGHAVFTPTLSGVGERSHLLSKDIDLEVQTLDVLNLILWEELQDIVLCGHSYGGMVATGVADRIPGRIRSLRYLDAFVPDDGQSLLQFAPIEREHLVDGWKTTPIPAAVFGVNEADRAWVDRQCTLHPLACFEQPVRLTGAGAAIKDVSYLYAQGWAGGHSPFHPFYDKARRRGWRTSQIDCGHDVMLDRPDAVVRWLAETT